MNEKLNKVKRIQYLLEKYRQKSNVTEKLQCHSDSESTSEDSDENIAMALVMQFHIETFTPNSSMD